MEVQALRQPHGTVTAPREGLYPIFLGNLKFYPSHQQYNTGTRRKKEMVSVLISLMWGANHRFSQDRERLLRDCHFQTCSTVVLREKITSDRLQNNRNDRNLRNHQEMLKN